jgi:hypothetical protein
MVMLTALGISSEFANVLRKILMRQVGGHRELGREVNLCREETIQYIFNTCLHKYT